MVIGTFLQTLTFHSPLRYDPLLAAIATLKILYVEGRRVLPDRVPIGQQSTHTNQRLAVSKSTGVHFTASSPA